MNDVITIVKDELVRVLILLREAQYKKRRL